MPCPPPDGSAGHAACSRLLPRRPSARCSCCASPSGCRRRQTAAALGSTPDCRAPRPSTTRSGPACASRSDAAARRRGRSARARLGGRRQCHREARAALGGVPGLDRAAHPGDQAVHERQAEPARRRPAGARGSARAARRGRRRPASRRRRARARRRAPAAPPARRARRRDASGAPAGRDPQGVLGQAVEHLPQPPAVGGHRTGGRRRLQARTPPRPPRHRASPHRAASRASAPRSTGTRSSRKSSAPSRARSSRSPTRRSRRVGLAHDRRARAARRRRCTTPSASDSAYPRSPSAGCAGRATPTAGTRAAGASRVASASASVVDRRGDLDHLGRPPHGHAHVAVAGGAAGAPRRRSGAAAGPAACRRAGPTSEGDARRPRAARSRGSADQAGRPAGRVSERRDQRERARRRRAGLDEYVRPADVDARRDGACPPGPGRALACGDAPWRPGRVPVRAGRAARCRALRLQGLDELARPAACRARPPGSPAAPVGQLRGDDVAPAGRARPR